MSDRSPLLTASLQALRRWQPHIVDAVTAAIPDPRIVPVRGKDGTPSIAARETATSSAKQLHSRYAPLREAQRLVAAFEHVATLVHLGCGGLHVPQAFLESFSTGVVLVIEPAPGVIKRVLSHIDLVRYIESGRIRFAIDESDIARELPQLHQPTIRDGIRVTTTSPWIDWEPQRTRFVQLRERLDRVTHEIATDYAGVVAFGRRWLAHTVENSLRIDWNSVPSDIDRFRRRITGTDTRIYGAGPSLDRFFANEERDGRLGIIVDTAAPAFAVRRRREYAIVVLDPQGWSPLHVRERRDGAFPAETVVIDLGAAPLPLPQGTPIIPMGSNHPLHQLLSGAGFPLLPGTAAQNVTLAAMILAKTHDAKTIDVVGADFGYPRGVTYARGTYHYGIADRRATRLTPGESFFSSMVYPQCTVESTDAADSIESAASVAPIEEVPFFRRPGMTEAAGELAVLRLRDHGAATATAAKWNGPPPDPVRFWSTHLDALKQLERRIDTIDDLSTVEILQLLGPEGRAHLPAIAAIQRLQRRSEGVLTDMEPLSLRYGKVISQIRSFIFSHFCRYSN